jgi:hypothetical protein
MGREIESPWVLGGNFFNVQLSHDPFNIGPNVLNCTSIFLLFTTAVLRLSYYPDSNPEFLNAMTTAPRSEGGLS